MSVIAFGSVKSSPGVTTSLLALAAVWPAARSLLIVEADPDGGDLAARSALRPEPGLTSLAAAGRRSATPAEDDQHVQRLPGGLAALLGPPDAEQAIRALEMLGDRLTLTGPADRDVLLDAGRLRPHSPASALVAQADLVVVVARPRLDELQHLRPRIERLTAGGALVRLLLIGEAPYPADEVAQAMDVPVLGVLPHDPVAAAPLTGLGSRPARLQRTALLRHARGIAEVLVSGLSDGSRAVREPSVSDPPRPNVDADPREPSVSGRHDAAWSGWRAALTGERAPAPPT